MPKKRVDVNSQPEGLTGNPFADLAGQLPADLPQGTAPETPEHADAGASETDSAPFEVAKTRKGGWPVALEKRGKGKVVTVVRNVSSGGGALLALLKKRCGAGGTLREDGVEIQGDHRKTVEDVLSSR